MAVVYVLLPLAWGTLTVMLGDIWLQHRRPSATAYVGYILVSLSALGVTLGVTAMVLGQA